MYDYQQNRESFVICHLQLFIKNSLRMHENPHKRMMHLVWDV